VAGEAQSSSCSPKSATPRSSVPPRSAWHHAPRGTRAGGTRAREAQRKERSGIISADLALVSSHEVGAAAPPQPSSPQPPFLQLPSPPAARSSVATSLHPAALAASAAVCPAWLRALSEGGCAPQW
jgi:hypothetical protein